MAQFAFNAANVDPEMGAAQLPVGLKQKAIITESEITATKNDPNSCMIVYSLRIVEGPNAGAEGAYRVNVFSSNPVAKTIAEKQQSALQHAVGKINIQDTAELHNIPFMIDVGYQKGQDPASGPDAKGYTEVKAVYDANGNKPKAGQAPQQAAQAQGGYQPQQQQPAQQQPAQAQQGGWQGQQQAQQPVQQANGWQQNGGGQPQGNGAAWK